MLHKVQAVLGKFFNTKEHQKTGGVKRSSKWPKYRKEWLKNNPECAACGNTKDIEVHHVLCFHMHFTGKQVREAGVTLDREFTDEEMISGQELELNMTNYITLCEPSGPEGHHLSVGHNGNFKGFNPNVRNDAGNLRDSLKKE